MAALSFIESPFAAKVEYEAWVASGADLAALRHSHYGAAFVTSEAVRARLHTTHERTLLVVVHLIYPRKTSMSDHACSQVGIALANGADGVFLTPADVINPPLRYLDEVMAAYQAVRGAHPTAFVGLNFMDAGASLTGGTLVRDELPQPDAVWTDNGVDLEAYNAFSALPLPSPLPLIELHTFASRMVEARAARGVHACPLWFAGFLFKGKAGSDSDSKPWSIMTEAERLEAVRGRRPFSSDSRQPWSITVESQLTWFPRPSLAGIRGA